MLPVFEFLRDILFCAGYLSSGEKSFPKQLSAEKEAQLLKQYSHGDESAREQLIEHNLRLVAHIAKKYAKNAELDDYISIGTIGLIKAISTFDHKKGNRLATYAARCIDNELLMYLRARKKTAREVSLYEPIGADKEGNQIHLMDIVESEEKDVVEDIELTDNMKRLYQYIPKVLNEREQEIIMLRYGIYNHKPVTQREIADKIGISRSYVSRIEKRALEKLKDRFLMNS